MAPCDACASSFIGIPTFTWMSRGSGGSMAELRVLFGPLPLPELLKPLNLLARRVPVPGLGLKCCHEGPRESNYYNSCICLLTLSMRETKLLFRLKLKETGLLLSFLCGGPVAPLFILGISPKLIIFSRRSVFGPANGKPLFMFDSLSGTLCGDFLFALAASSYSSNESSSPPS